MGYRIVLISDDSDFFDYIKEKIVLRKSDELFVFNFEEILSKIQFFMTSTIIINSESSKDKTLELLNILKGVPIIVSAFNEDEDFKLKCYKSGAFDYITLLTTEKEFQARLIPVLTVSGILQKNTFYRKMLADKNLINDTNEVFSDYNYILDLYLESINTNNQKAVFAAIAPSDKDKLLLSSNKIETVLLNNIRKNDIIMSYAANKYFVLMYDIDVQNAQKMWLKIQEKFSYPVYAGFCNIRNQKREHLINEVLNKLHEAINIGNNVKKNNTTPLDMSNDIANNMVHSNFKLYKQEFTKKLEQVINPVFYQIQQKYTGKLYGVTLQQSFGEGYGTFNIKSKYSQGSFKVTSPGFSKINIDLVYQSGNDKIDVKRISLDPQELEQGLLSDLLEKFIVDFEGDKNV